MISIRKKDLNRKITKIALPCLILALVLPMLVASFTAKPVEAGCGCRREPPLGTVTLKVDVGPSGGGDIEVQEIYSWTPNSYPSIRTMSLNDNLYFEAVPAPGYYFVGWSGSLTGNENPTDVTINTDMAITAHFFPEEFTSEDEMLRLAIPEGTIVLDKDGELLTSLELTVNDTPLPSPPEADIVGLPYDLGPHGTTFDQPITITCSYATYEIPPGVAEEDLVMGYYDDDTGQWLELPSVVDIANATVSTLTDHLSTYTIIAPVPPIAPAAFTPSSLSISPLEANIGDQVSISALVTNTGEQEASYTVTLKIDGAIAEMREITLAGGSETVTFTRAADKAGTYSVDVNGLYGSFTVREAPKYPPPTPPGGVNWLIFGPIIAVGAFLVIFLVVRLIQRRSYDYYSY